MVYTAKTAQGLRQTRGSLLEKVADEHALIQAAITALGAGSGLLTDGRIWIGDAGGNCAVKAVSGDITITREGVVTIGANKVLTTMILDANVTEAKLEDGAAGAGITQHVVKFVANLNAVGGLPVLFRIDIPDVGAPTNYDITVTKKVRVIDFWFINVGAAAHNTNDTLQLLNGASAITAAIPKTNVVNGVVRATTMDSTATDIANGGTLRVTATKATNIAAQCYVLAYPIA